MTLDTARGILLSNHRRPTTPGLFERVRKHFAHAAEQQQMRELDDRMLRDIGLSRAQIELREILK